MNGYGLTNEQKFQIKVNRMEGQLRLDIIEARKEMLPYGSEAERRHYAKMDYIFNLNWQIRRAIHPLPLVLSRPLNRTSSPFDNMPH